MQNKSIPYRPPALARANPNLVALLADAAERATAIDADPNLSDAGKRNAQAKMFAPTYKRIDAMRRPLAEKRAGLIARLERLGASIGHAPRATEAQRQLFLTLVNEMRRDPEVRARMLDRLTAANKVDPETQAMRRFFLEELPPELLDLRHAHDLMRLRLQPSLPEEAAQLTDAIREVDRELSHVEAALDSIATHADRDVLQAEGAVGRRVSEWTPEERASYAARFGLDALARAVAREVMTGAPVRTGHPDHTAPSDDYHRTANADMSDFFKTFVDPAEAAADAALKPAA